MVFPGKKKKKKILYIIDDLNVGGAQVHLIRLVPLIQSQFHTEIISLGPQSDQLLCQLQGDAKVTCFDMSSIRNPILFFNSFIKLMFYLKKMSPHIVHTYLNTANVFGLLAARIAGVQNIITSRRDMGHFRTGRLASVESFLSRHFAKKVFCVCHSVAESTHLNEKIPFEKLLILLNGVDVHRYQPQRYISVKKCTTFSIIASLNREMKGHSDLLKAISLVANQRIKSGIQLFIAGDGPLRTTLETEVKFLEIEPITHFLGELSDVLPLLQKTDVLVAPSHSEGISNAILEAMAMGIPVIATAIDGNKEVVLDGETGFLVPVRNPEALASSILKYANNLNLIQLHGANARERVKLNFSFEKMLNTYAGAYNSIVQ